MFRLKRLIQVFILVLAAGCTSIGTASPVLSTLTPTLTSIPPTPTKSWIRTFEGPDYGAFFDLVLTQDGNILAVGATNHVHMPRYSGDALFMRLTLEGDVLSNLGWRRIRTGDFGCAD
jgi:hypothetical protein